ncbi:MAG TPA: type II secretion system F family protein [Chloroflexota bacterium]|nr:type II secretion system F family protein [Chloroflexota bacterium]
MIIAALTLPFADIEPRLAMLALLFGLAVYLIVTGLPRLPKPDLRERLDRLDVDERVRLDLEQHEVKPLFSSRLLEHMLRPIMEDAGRLLRRVFARFGIGDLAELERKLQLVRPGVELPQFFGEKVASGVVMGSAFPIANLLGMRPFGVWPVWLWLVTFALGFFLPDWQLERSVHERRTRCLMELPAIVDLVAITLSSGMGLEQALMRAASYSSGAVAEELRQALREVAVGQRTLFEALSAIGTRNGVPELTLFVSQLASAQDQGLPLVRTLAEQAEMLREGKRTSVLEQGGKRGEQLILPIVLFIFPAIYIVLMVPAGVSFAQLLGN